MMKVPMLGRGSFVSKVTADTAKLTNMVTALRRDKIQCEKVRYSSKMKPRMWH